MNPICKIFNLNEAREWHACWQRLAPEQRSVYLLPEYYAIYEKLNHGKAYCFFYESDDGLFLYPFLKRDLDFLQLSAEHRYFDIEGAYGLNGAGHSNLQAKDIESISVAWSVYCAESNIIAEFTRMNPLLDANKILPLDYKLVNQTVAVDLSCDDLLYGSYEHSVRKGIKKAERLGVVIEAYTPADLPDSYLKEFCHIYETTMDRKSASDFYYFGDDYFTSIKDNLGENAHWFFAVLDTKIISVELVLFDESICYSFLGGTLKEDLSSGANVFLKHKIITYFKQQSLSYYFLGGGTTINDGIYTYKKSFSKKPPIDFYIGKKIHSLDIYQEAIRKWEFLNPDKCELYKNYFLKYRY